MRIWNTARRAAMMDLMGSITNGPREALMRRRGVRVGAAVDRRFTLLDAMVLVAAAALGTALLRAMYATLPADYIREHVLIFGAVPCLASTTLGLLVLSLRQPRPRPRRLMTRPGFAACVAASLALVVTGSMTALHHLAVSLWPWGFPDFLAVWASKSQDGLPFAVASAWATLALAGRWRAEPSWLDRLGRLVGLGWIAMYLHEVALLL